MGRGEFARGGAMEQREDVGYVCGHGLPSEWRGVHRDSVTQALGPEKIRPGLDILSCF